MPALRPTTKIFECEQCQENGLYSLAQRSSEAKRLIHQEEHDYRTHYARDRDRIIYSNSFRRLVHKTQVYTSADPSKFTTRLTHTLKVTQIAQTIARALKLNEDLAVAIALGHDIGHPPFGHLGEDILRDLMIEVGGFEHNEESVWILMRFEKLDLTFQTLDGILKHTRYDLKPYKDKRINRGDPFANFGLQGASRLFENYFRYGYQEDTDGKLKFEKPTHLEGQVVDIADEIAYVAHDLVDLRSTGTVKDSDIPTWWKKRFGTKREQEKYAIDVLVTGVIDEFAKRMSLYVDPTSKTIIHPANLNRMVNDIKRWYSNIFNNKFIDTKQKVKEKIETLFNDFLNNEDKIKDHCVFYEDIKEYGYSGKELVGHCIATMTDLEVDNAYNEIKKEN